MNSDEKYMRRAIQLARNGIMFASPNPMVGAVIVHNNKIIGEGFHRLCGEAHAEVNAVASVKDKSQLPDSTIYVTLEPCAHFGKTPPCAQLIIDNNIPRVVIGALDPFEKVKGNGVEMLRNAGCEVVTGVLDDECKSINPRFLTAHNLHRPFITLKWAQSGDKFIDHYRSAPQPLAARFSTPISATFVHKLRACHNAIMVGSQTIINDNPTLNCRKWDGHSPLRIVIDRKGISPATSNIFIANGANTLYISSFRRNDLPQDVVQLTVSPSESLSSIMKTLYNRGITSVLIEGGAALLQNAIDNDLWDMARVETAPFFLAQNGSIKAPNINCTASKTIIIGNNTVDFYVNNPLVRVKNL